MIIEEEKKKKKKWRKYETKESIHRKNSAINIYILSEKKENRRKGNENLMRKSIFFIWVCASQFEDQQGKYILRKKPREKEKVTGTNTILSAWRVAAFAHSPSRAHLSISYNQNYSTFSG